MAKKTKEGRLNKWWTAVKRALTPYRSDGYTPVLEIHEVDTMLTDYTFRPIGIGDTVADVERRNSRKLAVARLEQDRDAINKGLRAQHRIYIATLLASMVALFSAVTAIIISIHNKPPKPTTTVIRLDSNGKETIQTTN